MTGYDAAAYGAMLADGGRVDAYVAALEATVRPGAVVLDIGTGPGFFAVIACRLGARHVYALDPDPAIAIARRVIAANGIADRVTCIEALSTAVTLPERADVIVSDLRGTLPLFDGHIPAIVDARARHLAPGGVLIPRRDRLFGVVVHSRARWERAMGAWRARPHGVDLGAATAVAASVIARREPADERLLGEPTCWATLDYATIESPHAAGVVETLVERDDVAHGVALWFDAELAEGIGFSGAPGARPYDVYGGSFLRWPEPVAVRAGDVARVELRALHAGGTYAWEWVSTVTGADGAVRATFRQSTVDGAAAFALDLKARRAAAVP